MDLSDGSIRTKWRHDVGQNGNDKNNNNGFDDQVGIRRNSKKNGRYEEDTEITLCTGSRIFDRNSQRKFSTAILNTKISIIYYFKSKQEWSMQRLDVEFSNGPIHSLMKGKFNFLWYGIKIFMYFIT